MTRTLPGSPDRRSNFRQKFTVDEDVQLRATVEQLGTKNWDDIAAQLPGRSARQCRDRYQNYLVESLVDYPWTPEEDAILCEKVRQIGPHWVAIAKYLHGRSGNHVKNRWHKHLSKVEFPPQVAGPPAVVPPPLPDPAKPVVNLCEAIGVKECDLPSIFTQMEGSMSLTWGNSESFLRSDYFL
jgi:hypothetical protein